MNDWNECLARMATREGELVAKEKPSESKQFAEIGKSLAEGFAAGLESGRFTVIKTEELERLKRDLVRLTKDVKIFTSERDHCIDILRKIGIREDIEIDADSVNVEEFTNPGTFRKMVRVSFQVEDY